jgi:TetR/AcrR family transcriptional regulator, regulator of autoinduction and epiphytic fitness
MMHVVTKREYRSPLRAEQAAATRRRIVEAARELLLERGFAATKLDQVAAHAGVALPTLTGHFPNKGALLEEVLRAVAGGTAEDERAPLGEQLKALLATTDPRELLTAVAAVIRAANERAFELFEILRKAAAVDPAIEERRRSGAEARRRDQAPIARHLKRHRALLPGISEQQATDILWLYSSADVYRLLVHDSHWPTKRYEQWLAQTLKQALLAPEATDNNAA